MKSTTSSTPQDCPKQSQNVAKTVFGKSYFEVFDTHTLILEEWKTWCYSARIIRFFNISNVRNGLVKFWGDIFELIFFSKAMTVYTTLYIVRSTSKVILLIRP